jgi:hypothetical protein
MTVKPDIERMLSEVFTDTDFIDAGIKEATVTAMREFAKAYARRVLDYVTPEYLPSDGILTYSLKH